MAVYEIRSTNTKSFILSIAGKQTGILKYPKWLSLNSEITLADQRMFQFASKGFWRTAIELKENGLVVLSFSMRWNGSIIINTNFNGNKQDFIFRHKGMFKSAYVLVDTDENELLFLEPHFKWNRLRYDYNISTGDSFEKLPFKDIMLLTTVHCANYYMYMMSAA